MLKFVVDDRIPYIKNALENYGDVVYLPGATINASNLKNVDALITRTRTKCNSSLLEGSQVRMIASATIGYDHIDTEWCENNNIEWTNAPGCNAESVKQYIAAVLALLVTEKKWTLKGKSIAIVGVGNVGSKVSVLAKALGMKVYEVDPPRARKEAGKRFYTLDEIAHKADIFTFHTPLNKSGEDKTHHLCDALLLSKMKKEALVINSSRGEVVDGNALKCALQNNALGGAVLDVWENEPTIDKNLLDLVWIGSPHIAGYSQDGKAKGTEMSVRAVSKYFGLGLENWQATGLPQPEMPNIVIDSQFKSDENIIATAILHTYAIKNDDDGLRIDLSQFESLRGNYPVRREFQAYEIIIKGGNENVIHSLLALGFKSVNTM